MLSAGGNAVGLEQALARIALPAEWPWVEKLVVTAPRRVDVADVNDDLSREAAFYARALADAKTGIELLEQSRVPFARPADFYAEMVKSDAHMAKIKDSLIVEKKRMGAVEQRKKQKEMRKYSKQKRSQQLQAKAAERRAESEAIKRWKKGRKNADMAVEHTSIDDLLSGKAGAAADADERGQRQKRKGKKRLAKDRKFGGGKKKSKKGDAKSLNDFRAYKTNKL